VIRKLSVSLFLLVAIVAVVNTASQAQSHSPMTPTVRDVVVNGEAKLVGQLPASRSLQFDIVVALRHQPELENFLQSVYDRTSPSYRHFVTVPEFTERFGPSQEDYDAVIAFAKASGFTVTGGSRDGFDVQLKGTVGAIEKAFHVTMGVYQHPTENRTFYSVDREPTVAQPLQLWHITGLDNYSIPHPMFIHRDQKFKPDATTGSCPQASFCGSDMRAAYYGTGPLDGTGQNVGLLEYDGFDIADVNTYYQNAGQTRTAAVTGISTDGSSINCVEPSCDDTEQTLDITQALGMAPGVGTVYVYVGGSDTALLSAMSTDAPLPLNLSSSWTWETNPGGDNPYFEKMAAQGQSFFQATGDGGGYENLAPWPSNSQYVTGVGGTDLSTQSAGGPWASETAWVDGGGGWGRNVAIPAWQQLPGVITPANQGSTAYRNVADVSANANFTFYVCADQSTCSANKEGGTSFAAPMWAGYLALANQQAAINGAAPIGFINPTIYQLGVGANYNDDFHDIISGNDVLFPTTVGYDLATGWGSPSGAGLINDLVGPSGPSFTLSASPSSVSVTQGSSVNTSITVTPVDGFSGSVTLSASDLPSGVTASFSPNPTTGSSTLTLSASGTATTGTASFIVAGKSGSVTTSTLVTLTVNQLVQSFTLSASPSSVAIIRGQPGGTSTISITPVNGFSGNVTLSTSKLPKGVTASFSPNPATSSSVLTLTASSTATEGTTTVTITGTSGSLTATTKLTLTVSALGSFTLTASPTTLTVARGSNGTSTITVHPTGGFNQQVTLSAAGMPSGVTASFGTNPTTSSSLLTLTVSPSAATGKSPITITGTYGTLSKKTKVTLTVK
jgi:subtilase family serine protease